MINKGFKKLQELICTDPIYIIFYTYVNKYVVTKFWEMQIFCTGVVNSYIHNICDDLNLQIIYGNLPFVHFLLNGTAT